jgi:hypothetical protein
MSPPSKPPTPPRTIEHLRTEPAHLENCNRCGQQIIRALTHGHDTKCDPQHLEPTAELAALLDSRPTYNILTIAGIPELAHRDHWRIAGHHPEQPVIATHRCHPDGRRHAGNVRPLGETKTQELPDAPPF